jgi:hypothetical protein
MEFSSPPLAPKLCAIPYGINLNPGETLISLNCKHQKIINSNYNYVNKNEYNDSMKTILMSKLFDNKN